MSHPDQQKNALYIAGIEALASKLSLSVPEVALRVFSELIQRHKEAEFPGVIEACLLLNPGEMYLEGLKGIASIDEHYYQGTQIALANLQETGSDEHISPTLQAFFYLTGKQFP